MAGSCKRLRRADGVALSIGVAPSVVIIAIVGAIAASLAGCSADEDVAVASDEQALLVATDVLWPSTSIQVCWENPTSANASDRQAIQEAVEYWWNYRAGFGFRGWAACAASEPGVRMQLTDTPDDGNQSPHVKDFGRRLANVRNGIILPFTYQNHWRTECRGSKHRQCQQEYAVHEFGHVLGFLHEQARMDTPGWCTEADARSSNAETYGGPWDPESVMGYCSTPRLGGGQLSGLDIFYSMRAYGTDAGKAYFFEDWSGGKTGKKTGWYQGTGCHDVFSHHNDIYSAVFLGRDVQGVRVFRDIHCGGPSTVFSSSGFLSGWNDTVSSLQILY